MGCGGIWKLHATQGDLPMSADQSTSTADQPKPLLPVCPYCRLDPCVPEMVNATYGKFLAKIFICPNRDCRKVFNVSLVGGVPQEQRIVTPG
jgi:hypothetical protein